MESDTPNQQKAPSRRQAKLFKFARVSCPVLEIPRNREYCICGVYLHSFCATQLSKKNKEHLKKKIKNFVQSM
jgi:hypothetical protein